MLLIQQGLRSTLAIDVVDTLVVHVDAVEVAVETMMVVVVTVDVRVETVFITVVVCTSVRSSMVVEAVVDSVVVLCRR